MQEKDSSIYSKGDEKGEDQKATSLASHSTHPKFMSM